MSTVTPTPVGSPPAKEGQYTRRERFLLWLISTVGTLAVRVIGMTLRVAVHIEPGGAPFNTHPLILCFWHRGIFASTWAFRRQNIGVITSQSFDGEYIARIISAFGYVPIRGSSSRGGVRALLESRRILEAGRTVAFTTDGPRGPVYVTKPGPVLLASKSGVPLVAFHIAVEKAWLLKSWDRFMIPKPFSRALLCMSPQMVIPPDLEAIQLEQFHAEVQRAQDRVREFAENHVKQVGSDEFPVLTL
ncbi:MAG TPA: lysophospholipid acyltransferase family protein [Terriglobales bacterium]|nr:lysophospholipid acyltransferase family protein [Terriglobales bacterium]